MSPTHSVSSMALVAMLFALGGFSVRTVHAQGSTVAQSGTAIIADCAGGDATVNGSGDSITFSNACRALTVNGSGNTIQIELAASGIITLNGSGNRVNYAPVGGTQGAAVTDHGQGNTVTRMAALSGGTATITGGPTAPGGLTVHGANGELVQIGPGGILAVPPPGTGTAVTPARLSWHQAVRSRQGRVSSCSAATARTGICRAAAPMFLSAETTGASHCVAAARRSSSGATTTWFMSSSHRARRSVSRGTTRLSMFV
jgi:hypothetical protein